MACRSFVVIKVVVVVVVIEEEEEEEEEQRVKVDSPLKLHRTTTPMTFKRRQNPPMHNKKRDATRSSTLRVLASLCRCGKTCFTI